MHLFLFFLILRNISIDKLKMPSIQANRYEHANYCSSQCPLQKFVFITVLLPKISIFLHCAVYPLQYQHPYNRILEV